MTAIPLNAVHAGENSRFAAAAASVIQVHLDEIAALLEKRRLLNGQFDDACERAQAMKLSPKLTRQTVQLRKRGRDGNFAEMELLELYKAADGWYGADAGKPKVTVTRRRIDGKPPPFHGSGQAVHR